MMIKRFLFILVALAVAGGVGYGLFQQKYKTDRKFRKEADKRIAGVRHFFDDLMSPVKPDTKLMDKIHAENVESMIVQHNAGVMQKNSAGGMGGPGPKEDDRPRDEEGNILSSDGNTIVEIKGD